MARALSVYDGNGSHRPRARCPTGSFRGSDCRGNWAATPSGPLQSRHTQQSFSGFGGSAVLDEAASIWAADGRDETGIGGGASSADADGRVGIGGRSVVDCPLPKPRIGGSLRGGGFGSSSGSVLVTGTGTGGFGDFAGLDGKRGGRVGLEGTGGVADGCGVLDLAACLAAYSLARASLSTASAAAASFALASSSRLVGGSGGKLAGSNTGASLRWPAPPLEP